MQHDDMARLVFHLERFTQQLEQRNAQALQALEAAAENAAATVQQAGRAALERFEQEANQALQAKVSSFQAASGELERQMRGARKIFTVYAWKTFIASALGSLALIGVLIYVGVKNHQDLVRSEWVGQINAAFANGKLGLCPQGEGLCARVDGKRVVRVDR